MPPPPLPPGHDHTPGHACPVCDANRQETLKTTEFGALRFRDAAPYWLAEHAPEIGPKTLRGYQYYLQALTRFFGDLGLREIHIGHLREYQEWRQIPYKDDCNRTLSAGPSAINHELNTLKQIMERAGLWIEIGRLYHQLKAPKSRVGCALTHEEEERLFMVAAAGGRRWEVAFCAELLSANTTAGPGEIRHLRIRDLNLGRKDPEGNPRPSMTVFEGIKNEFRERTISLNPTAVAAVQQLLRRYRRILKRQGVEEERDHFLLPGRPCAGRKVIDFFKPQGKWQSAWEAIRERAGLQHVRMYDIRHHIITKMLENPDVSEQTVKEIAGHVSKRILDTYSHIRDQAKREALTSVETKAPPKELQMEFGFGPPSDFSDSYEPKKAPKK